MGSDPVVRHGFQKIRHEWIDLFGVTVEQTGPIQRTKTIREFLSSRQILDPEKRIFPLAVTDSVLLQFPGEPLMSVDIHLDLERKPCLQLHMHQSEITIDEIEIQEQTLAACRSDERFSFCSPERERAAWLQH